MFNCITCPIARESGGGGGGGGGGGDRGVRKGWGREVGEWGRRSGREVGEVGDWGRVMEVRFKLVQRS